MKNEQRETLPSDGNAAKESNHLLERAGRLLTQFGSYYLGSATVHYYVRQPMLNKHEYQIISQLIGMEKIPEGFADYGHKELQKSLMKAYGRSRKERK